MNENESKIDIRKKLKNCTKFNPFHDEYDFNYISHLLKKHITDTDMLEFCTAISSFYFNIYYKEYYNIFREVIYSSNLDISKLNELLFALENRDYCIVQREFNKQNENNKININSQLYIDSPFKELGRIDLIGALEGSVDFLNIAVNFTRYFQNISINKQQNLDNSAIVNTVRKIYGISNLFNLIKESYDSAIWENGYIISSHNGGELYLKYYNEQYPIILGVGIHRLECNCIPLPLQSRTYLMRNDPSFKIIVNYLRMCNKKFFIQSVYFENGFIKYCLSEGEDKESIMRHINIESSLSVFYSFIENCPLPHLENISVNQLIALFVELQQLLYEVAQIEIPDNQINTLQDIEKFTYRLKIDDLINYLTLKTVFSVPQINVFLHLLEYTNGRYDLWSKPLIRKDDYYQFLLLPIINTNMLYLVDFWFEQGGYSLDDRGLLFEKYIKQILHEELQKKGFTFNIPRTSKFVNKEGNSEQIDLIINLMHTLIIAEIKCIKFPMESRHRHNALKRLEAGAEQINRKAEFIYNNRDHFQNEIGNIEGKDILKIVITNFPIFTGLKINTVPIIDFLLLDSYVNSGRIWEEKIIYKDGIELNKEEINVINFYNNEDEFSKNIRECIECPPVIKKYSQHFKLVDQRITLDGATPVIFTQIAEWQE
ncbi:MAG: hypothetical protein V1681_03285 [Candidatus Neomarinimicrobiota bacterium]